MQFMQAGVVGVHDTFDLHDRCQDVAAQPSGQGIHPIQELLHVGAHFADFGLVVSHYVVHIVDLLTVLRNCLRRPLLLVLKTLQAKNEFNECLVALVVDLGQL